MPKIKITKHTQTRITDRLKILFGKSIIIGKIYDSCTVSNGLIADEPLKALYFENGTLLLSSKNAKYFVFLVGDMAAFRGRIFADSVLTSISFNEPITANTDFQRLKDRMHRVPPKLIDRIAKGVTG